MRIAIVQGAFLPVPPKRGGAVEKMWHKLGEAFAARGHAVTHLSRRCDDLLANELCAGVQHIRVRGYERPRSQLVNQVRDFLYTVRVRRHVPPADIVVTNTFWAPLLLAERCGRIYVDVQRMPRGQMRFYRRAARLRANSSTVANAIAAEARALANRIKIIPNPLPFAVDAAPALNSKTKTVLFAGRLHPEKGIELLLQAWTRRRPESVLQGWTLELLGPTSVAEGGGGELWARSLRERFPAPDIQWRPPIYEERELNRSYEQASVFVYPSLAEKGETFGLAVLEAMAWGAVPVVSDLSCFQDFIVPKRNGFVFNHRGSDPADALIQTLERAAQPAWRDLADAALGVRQTHALGTIAERFLQDFAELG